MLPLNIKIKNFMSYGEREESLDFSKFEVASLTGPNGAGKSSLLEAITWVLWGKARATNDEELVHNGQEEMEVEIEFSINDKKFRATRRRTPKSSILRLERFEKDEFYDISEDSIKETQEKLTTEILRMPYEVFINSAFLRQNRADEFTVKSPSKRKEILGEILGLSYYEELVKSARLKIRDNKTKQNSLETLLLEYSDEAEKEKDYQEEDKKLTEEIKNAEKRREDIKNDLEKSQEKQTKLLAEHEALKEKKERIKSLEEEIALNQKRLAKIEENIEKYQTVIYEDKEIEENYRKWEKHSEENNQLTKKLEEQRKLENKRGEIENRINAEKRKLEVEKGQLEARIDDIQKDLKTTPELKKELEKAQTELNKLNETEKSKIKLEKRVYQLKEEIAGLKNKNEAIKEQGEEAKEKLRLIEEAESNCPLCKQGLTDEHREDVRQEIEKELAIRREKWVDNEKAIENKKEEIEKSETKINSFERTLLGKSAVEQKIGETENQLNQIKEKTTTLEEFAKEFKEKQGQLEKKEFAPLDQEMLKKTTDEIQKINYDPEIHQRIQSEIEKLKPFVERKHHLDNARENLKRFQEESKSTKEEIQKKQDEQTKLLKQEEKATFNLKDLDQINNLISDLKNQLDKIDQSLLGLRERLATLKEKIKQTQTIKEGLKKKGDELKELKAETKDFKLLESAFGKDGIQAMIIENAIPEIENEANLILDRMTDGQMKVELETQKEKKTGGIKESLEIKITDKLGPRAYELFSGGEAFRINFAIRIALSKLLSRRANSKLQFLVIDEGFGTQDRTGRENLIEAINSIRKDFDKILVISHLQEVKDVFPVRIEVTKDEIGSHLELKE
ncbi:AAA family ATPase [Patescibacteria group bacterium]